MHNSAMPQEYLLGEYFHGIDIDREHPEVPRILGDLATKWLVASDGATTRKDQRRTGPLLVAITGPSGAGKSTIGRQISQRFGVPFVSKDPLKEELFDRLGWQNGYPDRGWSSELSRASYGVLYERASRLLAAGLPVIIESNFKSQYTVIPFAHLEETRSFHCLQVRCQADPETLMKRYIERSANRSPIHMDTDEASRANFRAELGRGQFDDSGIVSEIVSIDTTAWDDGCMETLYADIGARLQAAS